MSFHERQKQTKSAITGLILIQLVYHQPSINKCLTQAADRPNHVYDLSIGIGTCPTPKSARFDF